MKTCPECKGELSRKADACPHCGRRMGSRWFWMFFRIGLLLAFLFALFHFVIPKITGTHLF